MGLKNVKDSFKQVETLKIAKKTGVVTKTPERVIEKAVFWRLWTHHLGSSQMKASKHGENKLVAT